MRLGRRVWYALTRHTNPGTAAHRATPDDRDSPSQFTFYNAISRDCTTKHRVTSLIPNNRRNYECCHPCDQQQLPCGFHWITSINERPSCEYRGEK